MAFPPSFSARVRGGLSSLLAMATTAATGIGVTMAPLLSSPAAAAPSHRATTILATPPPLTHRSRTRPSHRRRRCLPLSAAHSGSDGAPAVSSPPCPSGSRNKGGASSVLTFQQAIQRLQEYRPSVGCVVMQCSNTEGRGPRRHKASIILAVEIFACFSLSRVCTFYMTKEVRTSRHNKRPVNCTAEASHGFKDLYNGEM